MEIIHVYGKLERPFDTYGNIRTNIGSDEDNVDATLHDVKNASAGIKLMAEGREDTQHLQVIQNIIHTSESIGFLGFGFESINVERIFGGIPFSTPENGKSVVATVKGMTEAESKATLLQVNKRDLSMYQNGNMMQKNCDCTTLLRESLILS
jgi:hypothetical protein